MNCCNANGECDHGPGCPAGAATLPPVPLAKAARTCESLGVCQHPDRECTGACEQKPKLHVWEPTDPTQPVQGFTVESYGRDNFVTCLLIAATAGATLGIAYGAGRWVWWAYQAWAVLS